MASENVDILLRLRSELNGIKAAQQEIVKTTAKTNTLAHAFKIGVGVHAVRALERGARAIGRMVADTLRQGVAYNTMLESQRDGIRAVLIGAQEGQVDLNAATTEADQIILRFRQRVNETSMGVDELSSVFHETAAMAQSSGVAIGAYADFMIDASKAAANLGLETSRLQMNLLGIFSGRVDSRNIMAKLMGIGVGDVQQAKEQGKLLELLTERIKPYTTQLTGLAAETQRLRNDWADLRAEMMEELFGDMTSAVKELREALADPEFRQMLIDLGSSIKIIGQWAGAAAKGLHMMGQAVGGVAGAVWYGPEAFNDWRREVHAARAQRNAAGAETDIGVIDVPAAGDGDRRIGRERIDVERQLLQIREQRRRLELDAFRTDAQKRPELIHLMGMEAAVSRELLELRKRDVMTQLAQAQTAEEKARAYRELGAIEQLETGLAQTESELRRIGTIQGEIFSQAVEWLDAIGSTGEIIGRAMTTVFSGIHSGMTKGFSGLLDGSMKVKDALSSVASGFWQAMNQAISRMLADFVMSQGAVLVQYAATKAKMFAIDTLFAAKSLALSVGSALKSLVAWIPAAIAASISSSGVSAAIGVAAVVAAMAAFGGFAEGGLIPGAPSRKDNRLIHAATGEYVVRAAAVQRYGAANLDRINAMQAPDFSDSPAARSFQGQTSGAGGGSETNISVVLSDLRNDILDEAERRSVRAVRLDRRHRGERVPG